MSDIILASVLCFDLKLITQVRKSHALPASALAASPLSVTDQSHIKRGLVSFTSLLRLLLTEERAGRRLEQREYSMSAERRGEETENDVVHGGGGMMKCTCSLTFEELVENVGTTSKEHHEIYNTCCCRCCCRLKTSYLQVRCFSPACFCSCSSLIFPASSDVQ